jgi:4'-phosphopantetheinyl transferase
VTNMTHPSVDHCQELLFGEIHVWTARVFDDDRVTAGFLPILDHEERARAGRFCFEGDRRRFIQTHGIVRRLLASYAGADAATLRLARNRYGKPHLILRTNGSNLQFSVSHSGDRCVLAVGLDHPIGIDLEKVRDLPHALDIAQSYFTPGQSRALAALRGAARRNAFFLFWVHKEATIKGLGISLAANLGRVEFALNAAGGLRFVGWEGDQPVAPSWSVLQFDPAPGYVAAVAALHPIRSLSVRDWNGTGLRDAGVHG